MNGWGVACGNQKGTLLLGMRERNKIEMEKDAGNVRVVGVNRVTG
jgi:hypothetical protein